MSQQEHENHGADDFSKLYSFDGLVVSTSLAEITFQACTQVPASKCSSFSFLRCLQCLTFPLPNHTVLHLTSPHMEGSRLQVLDQVQAANKENVDQHH